MFRRSWKTKMTASERGRGLVFFALYLLVFPYLNAWAQRVISGDGEPLVAEANVLYYALLFTLSLLLFWSFLKKDFEELVSWLPENLFGVVTGLLLAGGLRLLAVSLPFPVPDPIAAQYAAEYGAAPVPTLVLVLLLIPLVEEVLFRGLMFGNLRGYSRVLAYLVCVPLYALAQVWRYALDFSDPRYLLLAVLYLPMSAALTWCYDNGGSVWSGVALHGGLNAIILFTT
jgi:membrane protease YdiL (CAAX protease family)